MDTTKAMTRQELATHYGISLNVLRKWLKPFKAKIGDLNSYVFTPKQVQIIFECLG